MKWATGASPVVDRPVQSVSPKKGMCARESRTMRLASSEEVPDMTNNHKLWRSVLIVLVILTVLFGAILLLVEIYR